MTTGELVFYSGVGLLVFTLLLAVIFLIKRPQYVPEHLSNAADGTGSTQKLRSGYPTETLTHERASGGAAPSPKLDASIWKGTEKLKSNTVFLNDGAGAPEQGTVPLEQGTVSLEQGTVPLEQGTMPLQEEGGTELLTGGRSNRS